MKNLLGSLPARLVLGVIVGIIVGLYANESLMQVILTFKNLLGSLIIFCVPLIIIGFIAPSITRLGTHASTMLRVAITLAYVSSVGAALFAMFSGYGIIPHLNIVSSVDGLKDLPKLLFDLKIDPIMSVMSALVFSVLVGVAAAWTQAAVITKIFGRVPKNRFVDRYQYRHPVASAVYCLYLLRFVVRRHYHKTAAGIFDRSRYRYGGALSLVGIALRSGGPLCRC